VWQGGGVRRDEVWRITKHGSEYAHDSG
jgi:hypothetical protein